MLAVAAMFHLQQKHLCFSLQLRLVTATLEAVYMARDCDGKVKASGQPPARVSVPSMVPYTVIHAFHRHPSAVTSSLPATVSLAGTVLIS